MSTFNKGLGRRIPEDFNHVEKYPLMAIQPHTVEVVERKLLLPKWHWSHNQGHEGSCVGHAAAVERAITNSTQNKLLQYFAYNRRYNPLQIWNEAKKIDEWEETNPGDENGTSVRAAYDVLRDIGPVRIPLDGMSLDENGKPVVRHSSYYDIPNPSFGVERNRWAINVDEIRTAIAAGTPVVIGVNWYSGFDFPIVRGREKWIDPLNIGRLRGGHAVVLYAASDSRAAFKMKNSWGKSYPLVWLSYSIMERLLLEEGEACISVDR